jgi:hypothetical protein
MASATGSTGTACNAIRYGGTQQHAAQTFMNPYFGAFNYHWAAYSGGTGYLVNNNAVRQDGSAYCYATWWAVSNNGNKPPLGCQYYANVNSANQVTLVRWDNCHN